MSLCIEAAGGGFGGEGERGKQEVRERWRERGENVYKELVVGVARVTKRGINYWRNKGTEPAAIAWTSNIYRRP